MICEGRDLGPCAWWPAPLIAVGATGIVMTLAYWALRRWGYGPIEAGSAAAGLVVTIGVLLTLWRSVQ